jgi:hypothetical protein
MELSCVCEWVLACAHVLVCLAAVLSLRGEGVRHGA